MKAKSAEKRSTERPATKEPKIVPKSSQNGSKIDPQRAQNDNQNSRVICTAFLLPFWAILTTNMVPTWAPKSLKNRSKIDLAAQRPPRSLQGPILGPNWAYVKPFWAPNWPQECSFQTANARATFAKLALHNARLARLFTLAACSVAGFGGAAPCEI